MSKQRKPVKKKPKQRGQPTNRAILSSQSGNTFRSSTGSAIRQEG